MTRWIGTITTRFVGLTLQKSLLIWQPVKGADKRRNNQFIKIKSSCLLIIFPKAMPIRVNQKEVSQNEMNSLTLGVVELSSTMPSAVTLNEDRTE